MLGRIPPGDERQGDREGGAANAEQILARYGSNSDAMRRRIGEPERIAYGPTEVELSASSFGPGSGPRLPVATVERLYSLLAERAKADT